MFNQKGADLTPTINALDVNNPANMQDTIDMINEIITLTLEATHLDENFKNTLMTRFIYIRNYLEELLRQRLSQDEVVAPRRML